METIASFAIVASIVLLVIAILIVLARAFGNPRTALAHDLLGFVAWPLLGLCCVAGLVYALVGLASELLHKTFKFMTDLDAAVDRFANRNLTSSNHDKHSPVE